MLEEIAGSRVLDAETVAVCSLERRRSSLEAELLHCRNEGVERRLEILALGRRGSNGQRETSCFDIRKDNCLAKKIFFLRIAVGQHARRLERLEHPFHAGVIR